MTYQERSRRVVEQYNMQKERKIKLEERLSVLKDRMKKEFGVSTISELKEKKRECTDRIEQLESKIGPMLDGLEESLGI